MAAADAFVSIADSLAHDVVAQPRTKAHYTFLRGASVYKGPYPRDGKRLGALGARSRQLAAWQTPYVVHPAETLETRDGAFVRYANLCAGDALETTPYTERTTGVRYNLLVRTSLRKLSDVLEDAVVRARFYADAALVRGLVTAYAHLYALGAGDVGPHNTLARVADADGSVAALHVIDYEDTRGGDRDAADFLFSKPAAARKGWDAARAHYGAVAADLDALAAAPENAAHAPRLAACAAALRRWAAAAPAPAAPAPAAPPPPPYAPPPPVVVRLFPPPQAQPGACAIAAGLAAVPAAAVAVAAAAAPRASQARFVGMRGGATTFSGLEADVAKSALQKYVRRGLAERALVAAFELHAMAGVGGGRAVQSNAYNRLAVIAAEDVGVANFALVVAVLEYVTGREVAPRDAARPPEAYAALVHALAASPKTRVASHLWRAYATDEGRALAAQRGVARISAVTQEDEAAVADAASMPPRVAGDPDDLRRLAVIFACRLRARDESAVYWASEFVRTAEGRHAGKRGRRVVADAMLWYALSFFFPDGVSEALERAYYAASERRPFLMLAVSAALLLTPQERDVARACPPLAALRLAWRASPSLAVLAACAYEAPVVDDYAIDVHTRAGRSAGKRRRDFVSVGAHVENEAPRFAHAALRSVYEES